MVQNAELADIYDVIGRLKAWESTHPTHFRTIAISELEKAAYYLERILLAEVKK